MSEQHTARDGNGDWLLGVEITPVQRFIEAARSVRDLKTGSAVLCHLATAALAAGRGVGGTRVFPSATRADGVPNRFVLAFADEATAKAGAAACREAVKKAWDALAKGAKDKLDVQWKQLPAWDAGWTEQVSGYWTVHTAVVGPVADEDVPAVQPLPEPEPTLPFQKQWQALGLALALQKTVRPYPQPGGIGREKCTLFGDLEQMGPGGSLTEQGGFWQEVVKRPLASGLLLRDSDRLCAVALAKRLAPWVANDALLSGLRGSTPDTSAIAMQAWRADCGEKDEVREALAKWDAAASAWAECAGADAEDRGAWLLDDGLTVEALGKALAEEANDWKSKAKALIEASQCLRKAAARAGLGAPPRYLAVIKLDGDRIGRHLEQAADSRKLAEISEALMAYAAAVGRCVEDHHGTLVYAGGDDALALVPLDRALPCVRALRDAFPRPMKASAGLVYFHYKHPLREALEAARDAEHAAKEAGRDRLGWKVLKRGGGPASGTLPWGLAKQVEALARHLADGESDRWLHHLEPYADGLPEGMDEPVRLLLAHHLRQAIEFSAAGAGSQMANDALALFDGLRDLYQERDAGPILRQFVQVVLWATFIGRDHRRGN